MDLAVRAGRRLVELGIPQRDGLKWAMDPDYPRLMPNFSHGTAGIAYFLARLHAETGDDSFLEAALAGARYLLEVSDERGLVFHHEPDGENLFYLGWCHGPAGTSRLYFQLWQTTGDEKWIEAVRCQARAVVESGIPGQRTHGFWNNVGVCCGSAGVAAFFLELHGATGEEDCLHFARRLTGDLLARGTRDESGLRWIQAEHRVRPELLVAQTGYMQGAAGIGMWLLHLDAFEQGRDPLVVLPDSPFNVQQSSTITRKGRKDR
jgi:lantibiotic modifying enzyme